MLMLTVGLVQVVSHILDLSTGELRLAGAGLAIVFATIALLVMSCSAGFMYWRSMRQTPQPPEQLPLVGMDRESGHRYDLCSHADVPAEEPTTRRLGGPPDDPTVKLPG